MITLLILPSSLFDGFITLHDGLEMKFSLRSLRIIYTEDCGKYSIRSASFNFFVMDFVSKFIDISSMVGAFLLTAVMFY